ncbi:MAG TPA: RNA-binding protein [Firmicutes bacterium]|nr:RNA-binding protein [Bacillota bacterium]
MKTLYVGNLPWATTEDDLIKTFSPHVNVKSCRIITDRETGRSRGFGFVEVDDADVQKAISKLNGSVMAGREIIVNEAKPRQNKF